MTKIRFSPQFFGGVAVGCVLAATVCGIAILVAPSKESVLQDAGQSTTQSSSSTTEFSGNPSETGEVPPSSQTPQQFVLDDPLATWQKLTSDDKSDEGQIVELIQAVSELVAKHGWEALNQIEISLLDSTTLRTTLTSVVIGESSKNGFVDTFYDLEANTGGAVREELLGIILSEWTKVQPTSAFATTTQLKDEWEMYGLRKIVLAHWAASDMQSLLELMHMIPKDVRWYAQYVIDMENARTNPSKAASMFEGPIETATQKIRAQEIAKHWSLVDPEAARKWATEQEFVSKQIQNQVLSIVLQNIVKENPQRAIVLALDQPVGNFGIGVEGFLIENLAQSDPVAARELLTQARDSTTAVYAARAVGTAHLRTFEFDETIEIGRGLAKEVRQEYYDTVFHEWAQSNPVKLFEFLDEMPTLSARSLASMHLIIVDQSLKALTEDQVASLQENLTKEHRAMMYDRQAIELHIPPVMAGLDFGTPSEIIATQQQLNLAIENAIRLATERIDAPAASHSHEH